MKSVYCKETKKTYPSIAEAGRANELSIDHVSDCCNGKRKSVGVYHFSFVATNITKEQYRRS